MALIDWISGNRRRLAAELTSNDQVTLQRGLQRALAYTEQGKELGLLAIAAAIRRRSGLNDPPLWKFPGTEGANSALKTEDAIAQLLDHAKRGTLLENPIESQR
jgi:hypothetical protein